MFNIIQKRKIFFSMSGIMTGLSVLVFILWGFNLGIDFTGGSLLEVEFTKERPSSIALLSSLESQDLGKVDVQPVGDKGYILRFKPLAEEEHQNIMVALTKSFAPAQEKPLPVENEKVISSADGSKAIAKDESFENEVATESSRVTQPYKDNSIIEQRFDSIGPVIGNELKKKALSAIMLVLIAIVIYIAWAFRKVSWPVQSWKYGLVAIVALFHDLIVVTGVFICLGHFYGVEINTVFVAALLTILGYSVNDTIVVFDRIRENIGKMRGDFENLVNASVNETLVRSINTSITTMLVLLAVFIFGGSSIRDFVLALLLGVFFGTYSSVFLASPLLVTWQKIKK